ncbi:MAG TPA: hypothetical protein ENI52_04960 [Thermoplasmata archaeon]|nr:hypothetical protein [Thermoplasmata archaeon]
MSLPRDILIKRIKNELKDCRRNFKHRFILSEKSIEKFPFEFTLILVNTPGPVWKNGKIITKYTHKLKIILTENYPYQSPVVRWQSKIFHPNIMPPEEGGHVCTQLLEKWNFKSNLVTFIKGIEILLSKPNPKKPFGIDYCTRAAEYFNKHPYKISSEREIKKPIIIE